MEFKVMHRIHLEYFTSFTGNGSCFYFIRDHRSQCNTLANALGIYLTHIRVVHSLICDSPLPTLTLNNPNQNTNFRLCSSNIPTDYHPHLISIIYLFPILCSTSRLVDNQHHLHDIIIGKYASFTVNLLPTFIEKL